MGLIKEVMIIESKYLRLPICEIPILFDYDVIVCGGGPAGFTAALAAARTGMRVLLLESQAQLGGVGTSGLCTIWLGGYIMIAGSYRPVVGGIFQECVRDLVRIGAATEPSMRHLDAASTYDSWVHNLVHGVIFDPHQAAYCLEYKLKEAGVEVLYGTQAVEPVKEGERIVAIVACNKSGLFAVSGRAVVDATGDADMAARAGCETVRGRPEDGLMTPASLLCWVEDVDERAVREYMDKTSGGLRFSPIIRDLQAQGKWPFNTDNFILIGTPWPGVLMLNVNRIVGVDGTDGQSVSRAFQQGRREIFDLIECARRFFPGFEHCRLRAIAPMLGIRETRRIVGSFVLTVDDLVCGYDFPDTVGFTGYHWDLPHPKEVTRQPIAEDTRYSFRHPFKPIPYRCLVPNPVTNLICPGRAISVERDVLGPMRVMAPCMAMGEAAGLAASQVVAQNVNYADVDIDLLRSELRDRNAIIDHDAIT